MSIVILPTPPTPKKPRISYTTVKEKLERGEITISPFDPKPEKPPKPRKKKTPKPKPRKRRTKSASRPGIPSGIKPKTITGTNLANLAFAHVTYTLSQITDNKDQIFTYVEAFLNNRPQTKENLALAYLYHLYSTLPSEERSTISYEELLSLVTEQSHGLHKVEPHYLISAVSGGAHICNVQIAHTLASVRATEVVGAAIREATKEENSSFLDRKLILEITGLADKEKGIVVNNNITNQTAHINVEEKGIPKFMGEISANDSLFREHYRKALNEAKEEEIIDLAKEDIIVERVER